MSALPVGYTKEEVFQFNTYLIWLFSKNQTFETHFLSFNHILIQTTKTFKTPQKTQKITPQNISMSTGPKTL